MPRARARTRSNSPSPGRSRMVMRSPSGRVAVALLYCSGRWGCAQARNRSSAPRAATRTGHDSRRAPRTEAFCSRVGQAVMLGRGAGCTVIEDVSILALQYLSDASLSRLKSVQAPQVRCKHFLRHAEGSCLDRGYGSLVAAWRSDHSRQKLYAYLQHVLIFWLEGTAAGRRDSVKLWGLSRSAPVVGSRDTERRQTTGWDASLATGPGFGGCHAAGSLARRVWVLRDRGPQERRFRGPSWPFPPTIAIPVRLRLAWHSATHWRNRGEQSARAT